jgi:hypothetical protein
MAMAAPSNPNAPKIAMVFTRELDGQSMAGRLHTAQAIRAAMTPGAELISLQLPNVLTQPSLGRLASTLLRWSGAFLTGAALPLQCAIFANRGDERRILARIPADAAAIYLDSVRTHGFLKRLRAERPNAVVVVDFDDLMSQRMALLLQAGQSLSPGYLTKRLPAFLQKLMLAPLFGRAVVRFEHAALMRVEREIADLADHIVLVSSEDARIFARRLDGDPRALIDLIPPPGPRADNPTPFERPERFVFIGSDALTQNRLTIEHLVALWRVHTFKTPLVLVGLRSSNDPLPAGVSSQGYVETIAQVYDGRSVLLTPALIGGGIKTKVLEAFAFGAPVIGNPLTFEAMALDDYPLNVKSDARMLELLGDPAAHADLLRAAVDYGADYLRREHDPVVFARRWRALVGLGADQASAAAAQ